MRVVAQVRAGVDPAGVRAVVGDVEPVDVPGAGRVRRLADSDVEVVDQCERAVRVRLQREDDDEEALRRRVVQAARVGHELGPRTPVVRLIAGGVAVERVQVDGVVHVAREAGDDVRRGVVRQDRLPGGVEDVEDVVDGLDDVAVAGAEALVGRLDGELVAAARVALLVEVQPLEADVESAGSTWPSCRC